MPPTPPSKNPLLGGLILLAFPIVILTALYLNHSLATLPAWTYILFTLFFLWGLYAILQSFVRVNPTGRLAQSFAALAAAGFATLCFTIAWTQSDGWSGGVPFLPDSWNQLLPRLLFAAAGLLFSTLALHSLRKALPTRPPNSSTT